MLLGDIVYFNALKFPMRKALVYEEQTFTFAQLQERVNRLSNALLGIAASGDRIGILAQNCAEYCESLYGVPAAGMALTFLNFRLNPKEIARIISDAEASVLIVEKEYLEDIAKIRQDIPSVKHVVVIGGGEGCLDYDAWLDAASPDKPQVRVKEGDMAWLIYTSGTTGMPKGAMLSHKNLMAWACNTLIEWGIPQDCVYMHTFPMCHMASIQCITYHLRGCPMVLMRRWDPEVFLQNIQKYRVTQTGLAPTMINFLIQYPKISDYDTSSLNTINYGASSIPAEVLRRAMEIFKGVGYNQLMGQTETCGGYAILRREDHLKGIMEKPKLLTAAGKDEVLAVTRVVNVKMEDVVPGEIGEIVVQGDQVMMGYWRNPKATEEAFAGGWFHTGDMATIDEEGYIYVADRKNDMFISGGENIYPREVEEVIYKHPAVSEAAVIGVPDKKWGESGIVVVTLREGMQASEEDIINLCKENLASYKKPKMVLFVKEFPKNATGKILKKNLREYYRTILE